jgi:hypothetical protein
LTNYYIFKIRPREAPLEFFSESQQRAHPIVVGLPFGAEPPPNSFAKLASRFAEKRSPQKEAQAKQAMAHFHLIGELQRRGFVED